MEISSCFLTSMIEDLKEKESKINVTLDSLKEQSINGKSYEEVCKVLEDPVKQMMKKEAFIFVYRFLIYALEKNFETEKDLVKFIKCVRNGIETSDLCHSAYSFVLVKTDISVIFCYLDKCIDFIEEKIYKNEKEFLKRLLLPKWYILKKFIKNPSELPLKNVQGFSKINIMEWGEFHNLLSAEIHIEVKNDKASEVVEVLRAMTTSSLVLIDKEGFDLMKYAILFRNFIVFYYLMNRLKENRNDYVIVKNKKIMNILHMLMKVNCIHWLLDFLDVKGLAKLKKEKDHLGNFPKKYFSCQNDLIILEKIKY